MPANRIAGMLAIWIAVEAADIRQKPTPEVKRVTIPPAAGPTALYGESGRASRLSADQQGSERQWAGWSQSCKWRTRAT
jgi:hypothetical protein